MANYTDPWGFSKLDTYRECPARFKFQFVDKLATPSSPALENGTLMHGHCEDYLRGITNVLHRDIKTLRPEIADLREKGARPESAWGFTREWKWLHNWLLKNTWLRVKLDAHLVEGKFGRAIDFKTGKHRPASDEQVQIYVLAMLAKYPELTEVSAELWYLDHNKIDTHVYSREDEEHLRKKFEKMVQPLYTDTVFQPKPSRLCGWCPFSRSQDDEHGKPGPCKF